MAEACYELRLEEKEIRKLVKRGQLVGIIDRNFRDVTGWRILDPSERYKAALSAQENIMRSEMPVDLMAYPILTSAEFAELAGITQATVRSLILRGHVVPYKLGPFSLFTAGQVRAHLLKKERKEPTDRRARCARLVAWCRRFLEEHPTAFMTQDEVKKDDVLEGTLRTIMAQPEPERGKRLAEFWRRFELARGVAQSIAGAERAG